MFNKITVSVTSEDIWRGNRLDCCCCPIALAISREVAGRPIRVLPSRARIGMLSITLPMEAVNFIRDYDFGSPVKPFSFELEVPCSTP